MVVAADVVTVVDVVVVVKEVVVEVVVQSPPASASSDESHGAHCRSESTVASSLTYSPSTHVVKRVHSLSFEPPTGGVDSHSKLLHGRDVLHTTFDDGVAGSLSNSSSSQVECGEHSANEWLRSGRYVSRGQSLHALLDTSRYSPAPHAALVVVVVVTVVVVAVVVVVVVTIRTKLRFRILIMVPATKSGSRDKTSLPVR